MNGIQKEMTNGVGKNWKKKNSLSREFIRRYAR